MKTGSDAITLEDYERFLSGEAGDEVRSRVSAALNDPASDLSVFLDGIRSGGAAEYFDAAEHEEDIRSGRAKDDSERTIKAVGAEGERRTASTLVAEKHINGASQGVGTRDTVDSATETKKGTGGGKDRESVLTVCYRTYNAVESFERKSESLISAMWTVIFLFLAAMVFFFFFVVLIPSRTVQSIHEELEKIRSGRSEVQFKSRTRDESELVQQLLSESLLTKLASNGKDDDGDGDVDGLDDVGLDDDGDTGFFILGLQFANLLASDGGVLIHNLSQDVDFGGAIDLDEADGLRITSKAQGEQWQGFQIWRYTWSKTTSWVDCLGFYAAGATISCPPRKDCNYIVIGYYDTGSELKRARIAEQDWMSVVFRAEPDRETTGLVVEWERVPTLEAGVASPESNQ